MATKEILEQEHPGGWGNYQSSELFWKVNSDKGQILTVSGLHQLMDGTDEHSLQSKDGWDPAWERRCRKSGAGAWQVWLVWLWNWCSWKSQKQQQRFWKCRLFPVSFCDESNGTEEELHSKVKWEHRSSCEFPFLWVLDLQLLSSLVLPAPSPLWEPGEGSSPGLGAEGEKMRLQKTSLEQQGQRRPWHVVDICKWILKLPFSATEFLSVSLSNLGWGFHSISWSTIREILGSHGVLASQVISGVGS